MSETELTDMLTQSLLDPSARTPLPEKLALPTFGEIFVPREVPPERQAWLEQRRLGIGGSDIGKIVGLDPHGGALDVYLSKAEAYDSPETEDTLRGKCLEPGVLDWYARRTGVAVTRNETSYQHPTRPLARCTPDGMGLLDTGLARLVSVKCPRRGGDHWGDFDGSTRVPPHMATQLNWEDAVLSAYGFKLDPVFHLAALIDGDLRIFHVERDVELQAVLLEQAEEWWAKHVVPRVPPELDGGDGARAWIRRRFPADTQPARQATLAEEVLLLELSEAAKAFKAAEQVRDVARQRVEESVGDAGGLDGAAARVTWRARKDGVRVFKTKFNWEAK